MKIGHLAIWCKDIEEMKSFYLKYFNMECSEKYVNEKKRFSSYFLSFPSEATRIEIMSRPDIRDSFGEHSCSYGFTHLAISVGNKEKVDKLTEQLRSDGYKIVGEARTTGDGYYESVVEDCEGNRLEITE